MTTDDKLKKQLHKVLVGIPEAVKPFIPDVHRYMYTLLNSDDAEEKQASAQRRALLVKMRQRMQPQAIKARSKAVIQKILQTAKTSPQYFDKYERLKLILREELNMYPDLM